MQAKASKKFKVTTDSNHNKEVADNLLDQNFNALGANHKWVTDITYIPTRLNWCPQTTVKYILRRVSKIRNFCDISLL